MNARGEKCFKFDGNFTLILMKSVLKYLITFSMKYPVVIINHFLFETGPLSAELHQSDSRVRPNKT